MCVYIYIYSTETENSRMQKDKTEGYHLKKKT